MPDVRRPSDASPARLRLTGVSKSYGVVRALRNVDFELRAGEVMALIGENGAGKTTLVKVLSGLVRPDAGTIEMDGVPTAIGSSQRSQELGVAVVQQEHSSVPCLSVAENLMLGQRGHRWLWTRTRVSAHTSELLGQVGLGHLDPQTLVESLSVAESQLIEVARVLARDAQILIFDEPTSALSDAEIDRVLSLVRKLADEGRSIIYVTHRLPEVFRIADRVTVFRNGGGLPPQPVDALNIGAIIKLMLGRELATMFPERSTSCEEAQFEVTDLDGSGLDAPVSLSVRRGEILGLTGQLGSGAAQVVQALAGVLPGVRGRVSLGGRELKLRGRAAGIKDGVAYCSADRKLDGVFAGISTQRNLSSPWLRRVSRWGVVRGKAEEQIAAESARLFAIDQDRLKAPVGLLSGGNQQKVALGKWLGANPSVLLLEEPTRGVDIGARAEIYRHLRELCESGVAIVVASSDTGEVLGLCDRIAAFYRGRLTQIKPAEDWTEADLLAEVMHEEAS